MRLAALLLLALVARPAGAANIFLAQDAPGTISLDGRIVEGDAARFEEFMRGAGPSIGTLRLRSPGGRAAEAIKIGAVVRRLMMRTEAPVYEGGQPACGDETRNCVCASACVFVWVAGVERNGNAHLEVHRPSLPDGSEEERRSTTAEALDAYLTVLETPPELRTLIVGTPPDQLRTVPPAVARQAGGFVPSVEAILARRCPEPQQPACEKRILAEMRRIGYEKLLEEPG
jgi:hypothetical protein